MAFVLKVGWIVLFCLLVRCKGNKSDVDSSALTVEAKKLHEAIIRKDGELVRAISAKIL